MKCYTAADERADLAFLVGANYARAALGQRVVEKLGALADELDRLDGNPWVTLDGVSLGGAIRYELIELGLLAAAATEDHQ